jgi:asparagine synthetase B (glutamine-hydrolysing)
MPKLEKKFICSLDESFRYGYDDGFYNLRSNKNSEFKCYYQKAKYIPDSFKKECVSAANKISDFSKKQNKNPIILFSGGLDSEIVVRAFLESGRKFEIVTNRFLNGKNSHEIDNVKNFCLRFNLKPIYIDIDIENWLVSEQALFMAEESKCSRAEMLPTLKLLDDVYFQMNGIPVLGNGDFYLSKDINPAWRMKMSDQKYIWNYVEFEYILAWLRYSVKKDIQGSINFFQQTSELTLSMALDNEFQKLIYTNPQGRHTSRSRKYKIYKKHWNDIVLREKFHGCEQISNLCDFVQKTYLNKEYRQYTSKFKIPVKKFIELIHP